MVQITPCPMISRAVWLGGIFIAALLDEFLVEVDNGWRMAIALQAWLSSTPPAVTSTSVGMR